MRKLLQLAFAFLFLLFAFEAKSQNLDESWPPSAEALEIMKQKIDIIKGLPDSIIKNNPGIFVDPMSPDENNIYILEKYVYGCTINTRISDDPKARGTMRPYTDLYILNDKGEVVKTLNSGPYANAIWIFNEDKQPLPEGIYRVRVSYGKKYEKNNTKPSQLIRINIHAIVPGGRGGMHLQF